jgi:DNA repair protein RadA/Sms
MRLAEPAGDLALVLALASSATDHPLPHDVVALGEVGLAGEIRRVPALQPRLTEAARLGFRYAVVPRGQLDFPTPRELTVVEAGDVHDAIRAMGRLAGARPSAAIEAATA